MSKEAEVGDCLGQGKGGAGLVSAANLDLGLQRSFNKSKAVMMFGKVRIQPLSYQDDVDPSALVLKWLEIKPSSYQK